MAKAMPVFQRDKTAGLWFWRSRAVALQNKSKRDVAGKENGRRLD